MVSEVKIKATGIQGVTEITADGWDGKILRMSHAAYQIWRDRAAFPKTAAVYVLFADHFDRSRHGNEMYIGQTAVIDRRVDQHVSQKSYWSVVLIFLSDGDWMNVAFTQNIEHAFINWAKIGNRYNVMNGNDGGATHMGSADQQILKAYLDETQSVLRLAGLDIFETNLDGAFSRDDTVSRKHFRSVIRITEVSPICTVTIVQGSVIWGMNDKLIQAAGLSGVTYSSAERSHTFASDVTTAVESVDIIPKIFGAPLFRWKNNCGIKLTDVLEKARGA